MANTMVTVAGANGDVLREIERMERVVGKRMYRGLLKSLARVWNPKEIQDYGDPRKECSHTCKRPNEDCVAPRPRERRLVWQPSLGVLGSLRLSLT